jgi:hypothetical protein
VGLLNFTAGPYRDARIIGRAVDLDSFGLFKTTPKRLTGRLENELGFH